MASEPEGVVEGAPETWRVVTLGEACDESGGSVQTGPFGSQLHKADYVDLGIPSIMPQDIKTDRVSTEKVAYITERKASELAKYRVQEGDIVYSRRGDVERRALITHRESGWLCGTGCLRVRTLNPGIDEQFLYLYLGHPAVRAWVVRHAQGATMPNLNTSILRALPVTLPPLPEQRRIAAVLGALDDKIELNRKMNRTLEEMAQAIFKSWFVDFDGHDDLVDSELGPIPRGWRAGKLTDLQRAGKYATTAGPFGSKLTRKHYTDSGVPVIRGVNLGSSDAWFHDDGFVYVSEAHAESLTSNLAFPGDVLFTQRGTLGQVGLIPQDARFAKYVLSQSQMKLTCADWVPAAFVYLLFSLPSTADYIKSNAVAAGVPHINLTFLRNFPVVVPDRRTLARFHEVIAPLHGRITAGARESKTLADLRDTLLPKLISGELRVPEVEALVEVAS